VCLPCVSIVTVTVVVSNDSDSDSDSDNDSERGTVTVTVTLTVTVRVLHKLFLYILLSLLHTGTAASSLPEGLLQEMPAGEKIGEEQLKSEAVVVNPEADLSDLEKQLASLMG